MDCVAFRFTGAAGFMIDELANGEARRPYTAPGAAFALKDSTPDDGWRPLVAFLTWRGARAETMPVFYVDAANMIENGLRRAGARSCLRSYFPCYTCWPSRRSTPRRWRRRRRRASRAFVSSLGCRERGVLPSSRPRHGQARGLSSRHPRRCRDPLLLSPSIPGPFLLSVAPPADYPRGIRGGAATRPRGLSARHPRRCRDPPLLSPTRRPDPHRRVF